MAEEEEEVVSRQPVRPRPYHVDEDGDDHGEALSQGVEQQVVRAGHYVAGQTDAASHRPVLQNSRRTAEQLRERHRTSGQDVPRTMVQRPEHSRWARGRRAEIRSCVDPRAEGILKRKHR